MELSRVRVKDNERRAVEWSIYCGGSSSSAAYTLLKGEAAVADLKPETLRQYASRWWNSRRIILCRQEVEALKKTQESKIEEAAVEKYRKEVGESVRSDEADGSGRRKFVDYSDPANQRRKLNELVNTADDAGEALDALKVIIAGQRDDKQAAKEQQIQRFYTPERCGQCVIKQAFHKFLEE